MVITAAILPLWRTHFPPHTSSTHTHTHTPQVYFINFNIIIGLKHFPQSDKRTRIYIYTHEMRECLR